MTADDRPDSCKRCDALRERVEELEAFVFKCKVCDGEGWYDNRFTLPSGRAFNPCRACNSTGRVQP